MIDHRAIQLVAMIHLGVLGLSHVLAHRAWAEFFIRLRERGESGVFIPAGMALGFGSVVVVVHPVWSGIPIVLTIFGWLQLLKGVVYFCLPSIGLRKLAIVSLERSRLFIPAGVLMLTIAGLLGYQLFA